MLPIRAIIYRYLTNADFYNMYKPTGSEIGGGGQTYIDFPTQDVTLPDWEAFFADVAGIHREERTQGPAWTAPVRSVGIPGGAQDVLIYQRRPQSVSVGNQTLGRPHTNRVEAWQPHRGFPEPQRPERRQECPPGLAVFFVRCGNNTIWAGWFQNARGPQSPADPAVRDSLQQLLTLPTGNRHRAGILGFISPAVWLAEQDVARPFRRPQEHIEITPSSPYPVAQPHQPDAPRRQVQEGRQPDRTKATDAAGFQLDPERRKTVEEYAMTLAKAAYPGAEDTSRTESFDLRTFEGTLECRIEVKGTLGAGDYLLLTANEIANAHGTGWRTDLFVVSDITLTRRGSEFVASGGRTRVVRSWAPTGEDLSPTQYRYRFRA